MEQYSASFSSLCALAISRRGRRFDATTRKIELEFIYPVVCFQGPIYTARVSGSEIKLNRTDQLQLNHGAAIRGEVFDAQIDVVSEPGLPALIDTILEEHRRIVSEVTKRAGRLIPRVRERVSLSKRMRED